LGASGSGISLKRGLMDEGDLEGCWGQVDLGYP
jgi:hypothetical protein